MNTKRAKTKIILLTIELKNWKPQAGGYGQEFRNEIQLKINIINDVLDVLNQKGKTLNDNVDNTKTYEVVESAKEVIEILFQRGYIGFLRTIDQKRYVNFKHKDPRLQLELSKSLLLH